MAITAQTVRQLFLTENATLKVTNNNLATDSVNPKRTHGGTIGNSIFGQQGLKAEYNLYDLILAVINDMGLTAETPMEFADETSVAPVTPGEPLISEIETWATSVSKSNVSVIYTGTDTSTDPIKYIYFVDINGTAVLTTDTVPEGLSANLAIDNTTGAYDIVVSDGQAIKADNGGSIINLRDGADGQINISTDAGVFAQAFLSLYPTFATLGFGTTYVTINATEINNFLGAGFSYLNYQQSGLALVANLASTFYGIAVADNTAGAISFEAADNSAMTINSGSAIAPTIVNIGINRSVPLGGVGMTIKTPNSAYANQFVFNASGSAFEAVMDTATLTADRTYEVPDASGIVKIVRYVAIASPTVHTATTGEVIEVTTGAADTPVLLPSAVVANQVITIVKDDAGIGKVVVTADGIELINGATTYDLLLQDDTVTIISTGTKWRVIAIA